jgi:sarcosine oxidase
MPPVEDVDVVVVGAGIAGAATARHLARASREVVLIEQFEIGHKRGSSHGSSRIFRFAYDDPMYVEMAKKSLPLWRELEAESGRELIVTTGGFDRADDLGAHVRALEANRVEYELIDSAEATQRYPCIRFPSGEKVLFQADAGITRADDAVAAAADAAVANGAELRQRTAVHSIREHAGRALVETGDGDLRAQVAVVTAGGWVNKLLAASGIELPVEVTRQTIAYYAMADDLASPTVVDWEAPPYFSLPAPGIGVKAGRHHAGPVTDPDEPGVVGEDSVRLISKWVEQRYPEVDPEPISAETCIYTSTADESFIIERYGTVVVGSACSGHGFKFGPLTGARIAALC